MIYNETCAVGKYVIVTCKYYIRTLAWCHVGMVRYEAKAELSDRPYDGVTFGPVLHEIRCDGSSPGEAENKARIAMDKFVTEELRSRLAAELKAVEDKLNKEYKNCSLWKGYGEEE